MAVTVQFTGDAAGAVAAADAFNAAMNTMATNLVATQQQVHNFTRDADSGLIEFRNSVEKSLDAVGNKFKTTRDALGETIRIRVEHVNPRLAEGNTLAQNFGQSLGGVPGNATQTGITNIEKANVALQKLYATSNVSQARMEQLFLAIQTGSVRGLGQLTLEEQKAEIALRNLVKAFNNASTAGTRTADVMINFRTALRIVAIQQLHLLVSKLTQALLGNQKAASDFEIQIGQIQTITQKANLTTTQWAASLTNLSNNFGTDLIQTAAAAYEAASNQISKGAGVTVFLADAFELARTTAATAEQAVNILSSAINAYGGAAFEASRLSAILFKVADLGRVKVGEMANTFGNTATLAKALGISITELGASISTLTIQGIRYDTSATLVNNIILKLIKPTEAMSELFAKWGVTSGQAAIATYGFGGVLHKLGEELASGGLNRIGELESDMRAIRSVIGQTGGNSFQVWTNAFNEMADAQEQFDAAAKITAETVAYKLNKEANALHNLFVSVASTEVNRLFLEFTENIGGLANSAKPFVDTLLNMIKVMSDFTSTMIQWSKLIPLTNSSLANLVPTAVATYGAFRVGGLALAALTTIQTTYNNLIQQGTWQLIAQGVAENNITRGMALQTGATTALTTALNSLTIARGALLFGLPLLAAAISSSIASYYETQRKITSLQGELEAEINAASQKQLSDLNKTADKENQIFVKTINERLQMFYRYLAAIKTITNEANAAGLANASDKILGKLTARNFELRLVDADEVERVTIVQERIAQLGKDAQALQLAGKLDEAASKFRELESASKEYTDGITRDLSKVNKELKKLYQEKENKQLENSIVGLTNPQKIKKLTEYTTQLFDKAKTLQSRGMFADAEDELKEAKKLAEKVISLSDSEKKKNKGIGTIKGKDLSTQAEDALITLKELQKKELEIIQQKALQNEKSVIENTINGIDRQIEATKTYQEEVQKVAKAWNEVQVAVTAATKKQLEAAGEVQGKQASFAAMVAQLAEGLKTETIYSVNGKEISRGNAELQKRFAEITNRADNLKNAPLAERAGIIEQLKEDQKFLRDVVQTGDIGGLFNTQLRGQKLGHTGKTFGDASQLISFELKKLQDAMEAEQKINAEHANLLQTQQQLEAASLTIANKVSDIAGKLPGVMETLKNQLPQALTPFSNSVNEMSASAEKAVQAALTLRSIALEGGRGRAVGGFADGGLVGGPLGRDNQLYKLHQGEFVVNREAARNFTPLFTALNSGGNGYRGLTSNGPTVNVGDIHMHMSSNNSQQNVEEFANKLRRALRAKTARLV